MVLIAGGWAGVYTDHDATAPWTRPGNEFVAPYGMFTAVQFALMARRHMSMYGTTPEQLATVSATIRNNGHDNSEAVYHGRGPYSVSDILASRLVADPFHLLDCAMTAEGAAAMLITTADRAKDLALRPVFVHGVGQDHLGPTYQHPPVWDLIGADPDIPAGFAGRRAARRAFAMGGLSPSDVDVCELYDPFSFEIIRQFEAFDFCGPGEGGPFIMDGRIGRTGRYPICTDGGLMAFSHPGWSQQIQRVIRGVHQLQGACPSNQVEKAEVALCTIGGSGALYCDVLLLGSSRP
jgi:acetyl-CoA acetyltransferase